METFVDIGIWGAIIMVIIAIIASVVMPLINSLSEPRSLLKSLYGVVFIGVVFIIAYLMAGDEVTANYISYNVTTPGLSKMVGAGLTTTMILAVLAVIGIEVSEVNKALKS